jgi:hypothetical protein
MLATSTFASSIALADDARRLGLVGVDPTLDQSASLALSAWNVDIVPLAASPPSADVGAASRAADALARENRVDAVAWLVDAPDARTLLLYDARTGQVVSREVATGPLDDATAAAIALSLKTLLRASTVAPVEERIGAEPPPPHGPGQFRLEGDATVRLRASNGAVLDPRVGLAFAWWPRPFNRVLGLALRIEEGTGLPVQNPEMRGRLTDHAASLVVRARFPVTGAFTIEPYLGGALHLTLLDGATVDGEPITDLTRVDPTLEAGATFSIALGRSFEAGLRGGVSIWQATQEYDVDGQSALTLSPVQASVGLVIGAALNP